METSRPAAGTASATWWAHWRPRLATSKRVNATASRASAHSPAISAWKTITISPLTAVKVTFSYFYFYIRAHPVRLLLRRFGVFVLIETKQKTGEKRNNKFPFERENVSTHKKMACQKVNQKWIFGWESCRRHLMWPRTPPQKKKKKVSGFYLQLYSSSHFGWQLVLPWTAGRLIKRCSTINWWCEYPRLVTLVVAWAIVTVGWDVGGRNYPRIKKKS